MTSLLFDAPHWLMVLLALAGVGTLIAGLRNTRAGFRKAGIALIAVAVLLMVLRVVVPTAEKKVEKQARGLMEAISKNDWPAVGQYVSHAQLRLGAESTSIVEGEDIATKAKNAAKNYGMTDLDVGSVELVRQPNVIVVNVSVTTHHKDFYVGSVPSSWSLEYQERPQGWVLTNIVPIRIGGMGQQVSPKEVFGK